MLTVTLQISQGLLAGGWEMVKSTTTLAVIYRRNGFLDRVVVTFDQLSAHNHARDRVSGDSVVVAASADHVHICTSEGSWYQSPDIIEIISAAAEICRHYMHVVSYGHSMGGYAALLFSGALNATAVLAFAPQFSVDPTKVLFERRFLSQTDGVKFLYDDMLRSASATARKVIAYDPNNKEDRSHVEHFLSISNLSLLPLPFTGHLPAEFLMEAGCLSNVVRDILAEKNSINEIRRIIRGRRRKSPTYLLHLASRLGARGNLDRALQVVTAAYVLKPENVNVYMTLHVLMMCDAKYYAISHAMARLIMFQQPAFTQFQAAADGIWRELTNLSKPILCDLPTL